MAEKVLNDKSANEKVYDIFNMPYVKENPRVNPTAKKILNDEFTLTDIRKIYKEAKEKLYEETTSDLLDDYVYWGPNKSHTEEWGYDSSDMAGGMGYNIFDVKDVAFTDQGYGMGGDIKRTDKFDISLELAL